MVARIRSGKSLKGAVNYNEHKVREGKAALLMANGYSRDIDKLQFSHKLNRLQKLAQLNTRVLTNCLHLSLNFDIGEKLDKEKLKVIATSYMEKIGFGKQPYLVYEHHDAAHQHVHIVTTNIQKDGKRISLHNLGKVQSEKARQEIEVSFGLVRASDKQNKLLQQLQPIKLDKVMYGTVETKRAISNVVTAVVSQYKFASIPELNAVLKQYNVIADRGGENTRMFKNRGLQYCLLDKKGNKIGKPIKASSIYGKPVLARLESMYTSNKEARQPFRQKIKSNIDQVFERKVSMQSFVDVLKKEGIDVVYRHNANGILYGITYVDHATKSVFNGSELGKAYSAAALQERFQPGTDSITMSATKAGSKDSAKSHPHDLLPQVQIVTGQLSDRIIEPSKTYHYLPYELKKKRKRKRRNPGL